MTCNDELWYIISRTIYVDDYWHLELNLFYNPWLSMYLQMWIPGFYRLWCCLFGLVGYHGVVDVKVWSVASLQAVIPRRSRPGMQGMVHRRPPNNAFLWMEQVLQSTIDGHPVAQRHYIIIFHTPKHPKHPKLDGFFIKPRPVQINLLGPRPRLTHPFSTWYQLPNMLFFSVRCKDPEGNCLPYGNQTWLAGRYTI